MSPERSTHPDTLPPQVGELLPPEREAWDRRPHLTLSPESITLGTVDKDLTPLYEKSQNSLYSELIFRFDSVSIQRPDDIDVQDPQVALRSIYLGKPEVPFDELLEQTEEESFRSVARNIVPELLNPFALRASSRLTGDSAHRNFINTIIYDKTQWRLDELSDQQKEWLFQRHMAADFAFKHLFVGFGTDNPKSPIDSIELSSLEGGHPAFYPDDEEMGYDELARRLRAFGSVQGSPEIQESSETVPRDAWLNSKAVNSLIELGTFIGEQNLVARNINPEDLTNNRIKRQYVRRFSSMKKGAEGAFRMYDEELGVDVVTGTGSAGVVKTDLSPEDLVAFRLDDDEIYRLRIEGMKPIKESVEAHEFSAPQRELSYRFPVEVDGEWVPPIRWTVHLHQEVTVNSKSRPVIAQNIDEIPPTGCGTDYMDEISMELQGNALEEWESSGRKLPYSILRIPNHGITVVGHWAEEDSMEVFKNDILSGDTQFTRTIPQE